MNLARKRTMEKLLGASLLTLAVLMAWDASHATATQAAPCQNASTVDAALKQHIAATRSGPVAYYRFGHGSLFRKQRAQALYDVRRAICIAERASRRLTRAFDVRGIRRQHADAGTGIRYNAR